MKIAPLVAAVLLPASAHAQSLVVAVFDIEAPSLKLRASAIDGLSEYLATQVASAGTLRVVPRSDLHERLKAQKVSSFKSCYDDTCQIEVGKELAAQAVLSTKLIRIDKRCVATMKLYDLKSATAIAASTQEGECGESGLLQLLGATSLLLIENAKGWQLRAAWEELEAQLPSLDASQRKERLQALLQRHPNHAPAIQARDQADRELQTFARAEAEKNQALGKVQVSGGAWCYAGQAFANGRCVGIPTACPPEFVVDAPNETCVPPPCTSGRERLADGVHCCWKGQAWSAERRMCVGNPVCPSGQVAHGQRCGEPTAPLVSEVRRLLDNYDYRVHIDRDPCSSIVYRYQLTSVAPCRFSVKLEYINETGDYGTNCQDMVDDAGGQYSIDLTQTHQMYVYDRTRKLSAYHPEEAKLTVQGLSAVQLHYVAPIKNVVQLSKVLQRLAYVCGKERIEIHTHYE